MGSLSLVAESVHGSLSGSDRQFAAVSTDTRKLERGDLFFALRGERFDAAQFVAEAERLGAAGAVVESLQQGELPQIQVADTRRALGDFARAWRRRFALPVIGVTGSNGKTTVREMTGAILRAEAGNPDNVLVTRGNFNNDIGLPLMVLRLREHHHAAVFEMGANHPGEIDYLAGIAAPGIGVVTNAGPAHLEGFGDLDGVARAKGELFARLPADAVAVINRDDPYYEDWRAQAGNSAVLSFGLQAGADFTVADLRQADDDGAWCYVMHTPVGNLPVRLPMAGQHNVRNSLAAAAAAVAAGADINAIAAGLATVSNIGGRLRRMHTQSGAVVYDDSYNANPASVRAAIDFLAAQPGDTWLVLGDMGELGRSGKALHREVGAAARAAGIGRLSCIGELSRATAKAFGAGADWYADCDALIAALQPPLPAGLTVLVKASRAMGLERVVAALTTTSGEDARP